MRVDGLPQMSAQTPLIIIARSPRFTFEPEVTTGPQEAMLTRTETWQLQCTQWRYYPGADRHEQPYGSVNGQLCEVILPDKGLSSRVFLDDFALMEMHEQGTWHLVPNLGPLKGHIEIHATNLTPRWVLRYPTVNSGAGVELMPRYLPYRPVGPL